jgi:hypothetical protein
MLSSISVNEELGRIWKAAVVNLRIAGFWVENKMWNVPKGSADNKHSTWRSALITAKPLGL